MDRIVSNSFPEKAAVKTGTKRIRNSPQGSDSFGSLRIRGCIQFVFANDKKDIFIFIVELFLSLLNPLSLFYYNCCSFSFRHRFTSLMRCVSSIG